MKFSIITPTFNSVAFVDENIRNIQTQTHKDIEHIIIDGGSNEGTVEKLKAFPHIKWISERDKGQSDAINKGFRMSSGDILAWQNVDDLYMPDTIKTAADFFINNPDVDIIYGDYQLINFDGSWRCTVYPIPWNKWLFAHGRFVPLQPTLFWRRRVYEHVGELDLNLHYCMDVDFLARASKKFSFVKIPKVLGKFRIHNKSKTQNPENKKNVECEYFEVLSHHFKYNLLDRLIFILFQKRKKYASFIKRRYLREK